MSESKIEKLRHKDARDLSDEEVLELLKDDIDSKGEVPTSRDLRGDNPWSVTEGLVERAAGSVNNALWLLGEEPNERLIVNGDTELVEHELRGLEHELGRPPLSSEGRQAHDKYDEDFRKEAGIPYHTLSRKLMGTINPQRENELVEMLFVDQKDPAVLKRNNETREFRDVKDDERAAGYEIDLVSEAYLPWVDETTERDGGDGNYEVESAEELPETVFELMTEEGMNQTEVSDALGFNSSYIRPITDEMEEKGLIKRTEGFTGKKYTVTDRGKELYENGELENIIGFVDVNLPRERDLNPQEIEEFDGRFSSKRTLKVFELLGEGKKPREIAENLGNEYYQIQNDVQKLKKQGLAETKHVLEGGEAKMRTVVTDEGEDYFEKIEDIEVGPNTADFEGDEFSGDFHYDRTSEILELFAEGYTSQTEIADELGVTAGGLKPYIQELKQYGFIESKNGQGTWLTEEGEEVYEQHIEGDSKDLTEETSEDELKPDVQVVADDLDRALGNIETLADVYSALGTEASIEIFDLLNQGHSRQEIAKETGMSVSGLQNYMDKYKEMGWIESVPGKGTEVTEVGDFFYKKLIQDDSVMDFVYEE